MGELELQIFSNRLKGLRQSLNMTQQEFVADIGITASALSAYEKNQKNPSIGVVKRIAEKYNISIDWLCGLSDKKDLKHPFQTYGDIVSVLFDIDDYTDMILGSDSDSLCPFLSFEEAPLNDFLNEWKDAANVLHNTSLSKEITQTMYDSWKKSKLEDLNKKNIKKRKKK
nr:MAG TPA_asm: helix-turn-helix domain protein [Caudoviricetes sp.]